MDADSFITLFIPVHYVEVAALPHLERKTGKSCLGLLEVLPSQPLHSTLQRTPQKDLSCSYIHTVLNVFESMVIK